ncbi:MAG TPA: autotransporter assembly complex family protein [Desulfuromonadaceae bacterium]|jgi:translocation and assembly module TamA
MSLSRNSFIPAFKLFIILGLFFFSSISASIAAEPVEVVVEGIQDDAEENVRQALVLPHGLVREGMVDKLWLERFVRQADEKVRSALEPFGFYNALVTVVIETPEDGHYRLRVRVAPGQPVLISDILVSVEGAGKNEEPLLQLIEEFPLHKGDVLLQQDYEKTKNALKFKSVELGYLDADFPVHQIRILKSVASATVDLTLDTGNQYRFNGVTLEGAPDYPDDFLRRYLAFKAGEVFSYAKLGESQLNLANSERFKEVLVTPEKQAAADLKVPVLVQLKPAPRRSLRPGLGYGTDTGGRFSLRYRDLNMFHRGHELSFNLFIAERLQGLATAYTIPSSTDIKTSTVLQLNLQREDVSSYISRLIALELDRNLSFGRGKLGTAYIRLQEEDFTIGAQNSSTRLVLPGVRFTNDQLVGKIRPTEGYRYGFDLRGTHQFMGSDTSLLQVIGEGSHLLPLAWRLSLHSRARAGITMLSDPLSDIPPSLRFFAGGDQSVRGYSYKSLGPKDATGQVVGGKQLLAASLELERALFDNWGVSVFYDAGNAFNDFNRIKLYEGAGVGLHYYSPVGALNLFLARQIGVEHPGYHIHFTVGFEL